MAKLANRARMTTATTGTGVITLGSATSRYQSFAAAGVNNGDVVRYAIEDGTSWEIGTGVYTSSGTTLSRNPSHSSANGAAINLSGGAIVYITAAAADLQFDVEITGGKIDGAPIGNASPASGAFTELAATGVNLSGVTAQALHRSPNAITAMFLYDTSKDSDGGAWTERCQHTSWWNEAINGKWLGTHASEFSARNEGATLGPELIANGSFAVGSTGWASGTSFTSTASVIDGELQVSPSVNFGRQVQTLTLTPGKTYFLTGTIRRVSGTSGYSYIAIGFNAQGDGLLTGPQANTSIPTPVRFAFVPTTASVTISLAVNGLGTVGGFDNISVREVTALTTASGDYFQLTTDGRFYRLWKNLLRWSEEFDNATIWSKISTTVSANADTDPIGQLTADQVTFTAGVSARVVQGFAVSGSLTYTLSFYVKGTAGQTLSPYAESSGGTYSYSQPSTVTLTGAWQRVEWQHNTATGNTTVFLNIQSSASNTAKVVSVWGAQTELGSVATAYERKTADSTTSEVFRGNKRDFPRLAGIVAEAGNVTIYDLTEAGRPMWMRFVGDTVQYSLGSSNVNAIAAMNGQMAVGLNRSGYSNSTLMLCSFAVDKVGSIGVSGFPSGNNSGRIIANRNTNIAWDAVSYFQGQFLAGLFVNAVAMTVLPDAPVDPVTNLRVPTIAVATAGGISVIRHDGVVRNSASTSSFSRLAISKDNRLHSPSSSNGNFWHYSEPVGSLGASFQLSIVRLSNFGIDTGFMQTPNQIISNGPFSAIIGGFNPSAAQILKSPASVGGARSSNVRITNNFNTGWMTGDIRRCFLSDTTVGSLVGTQLVTNGDNETAIYNGVSIVQRGIMTRSSEQAYQGSFSAKYTCTDASVGDHFASVVLVPAGVAIEIDLWVYNPTGNFSSIVLIDTNDGLWFSSLTTTKDAWVNLRATRGPKASQWALGVGNQGAVAGNGFVFFVDNVSVREAIPDRSYKAASATINGTVTRAQLASGTSLVGYSGFSAANYLREPYSADLDFGTGEFTATAWVNIPTTLPVANFPVIGPELVVNGAFDANSSANWTLNTWTVANDRLEKTTGDNLRASGALTSALVSGRHYRVTLDAIGLTASVTALFRTGIGGTNNAGYSIPAGTATHSFVMSAVDAHTVLQFFPSSTGFAGAIDNISVREVGAAIIADRAASIAARFRLGVTGTGLLTAEAFDGTTTRTVTTTAAYNTATWLKARVSYTTDGTLAILVNGREVAATRGTPLLTMNNTSAVLTIGNSFALDAPFPGSIALLKLGATVPTAEQATFMFEQEKQLFRADALSVLPDSGAIVDMSYDDATDRWVSISATNESYWTGLVRNSVTPVPAGSYSRVVAGSGVELSARSTTNPGVDVTIPPYGLREELVRRAEAAARLNAQLATYDYVGGFTANTTTGSTAITSVANLTYPTSYVGARISGAGIPANTTIVGVSGTTIYLSAAATATATGVSITFSDFRLPVGMEAKAVFSAGVQQREGSTAAFTRLYDGFVETIRFATAPGATTVVQVQAARGTVQ